MEKSVSYSLLGNIGIAWLLFRCNDTWKFWWDILILALAVVICFLLPFEIAFHPPWGTSGWWKAYEYIVEAFFALDVICTFNTSVYDKDGNEIFDRKHIAIDYLCELHFWIDLASTIPLGVRMFIL